MNGLQLNTNLKRKDKMTLEIGWNDIEYEIDSRIKEILLDTLKFDKVMPIQKACVPIFSRNYDVAVEVSTIFC